ncbi:MAG: cation-translocating P-type ATPase [Bacteroidota bacterium]|nr:cation-translocating P-type ATPase [Bacteroidota bacterium]
MQEELIVQGMHCQGCADSVRKELEKKGLEEVYVDFVSAKATFQNSKHIPLKSIIPSIQKLGYTASIIKQKSAWYNKVENLFLLTLPFTIILLSHMFVSIHLLHNPWFQLIICLPVLAAGIWVYGKSAWASVKGLSPNMNVLIMLGALASFIYSLVGLLIFDGDHNYIFFETTASIISFVMLGSYIEKRAVAQTTKNLDLLKASTPLKATKLLYDLLSGKEEQIEVDARQIKKGDTLMVVTGSQIPADGIIINGKAIVDESLLTGESPGMKKNLGDKVIGGSLLNEGWLKITATSNFSDSTLSRIVSEVEKASSQKPEIQLLADKISAVFVPAVCVISLITLLANHYIVDLSWGQSLMRAVAVLVISCPCALGLATPLAVVVGLGRAARKGIIVKAGLHLETLAKVNAIVFDKTGTLTSGKMKVSAFESFDFSERDAKNYIHFLETHSSHPIAQTIVRNYHHWRHHSIAFDKVEEVSGMGVKAFDHFANRYTLGSLELSIKPIKEPKVKWDIYLTLNETIVAAFNLEEELKPGALEMVQVLKQKGFETIILSGDSQIKCDNVAKKLGIDKVYARALPSKKADIIKKLAKTKTVAMIGDGINDTIAMAKANIGIAVGGAADLAREHANIVILKNEPDIIIDALTVGQNTYDAIKQNLWWALAYNTIAIPLAAMGYLSPLLAAWGMAFSDVVLVLNTLWKLGRRK